MNLPKKILDEIVALPFGERSELIEILLASLDKPDAEIDSIWKSEVEQRIDRYDTGKTKALKIEEILTKYK